MASHQRRNSEASGPGVSVRTGAGGSSQEIGQERKNPHGGTDKGKKGGG